MSQELSFTSVLETAAKLPLVHIDREKFLTDNLSKVCTTEQLNKALDCGTLQAGIAVNLLDSIANAVINAETLKVTTISAAAGLPGGLAMLATIPADLAQFYGLYFVPRRNWLISMVGMSLSQKIILLNLTLLQSRS